MVVSMIARNFNVKLDTAVPSVKELFTFTMTLDALLVRLIAR